MTNRLSPGCCCITPCGTCNIPGPFTTARYKIEISGIPSSIEYQAFWTKSGDSESIFLVTATNLDAFNGTYYVTLGTEDGCPTVSGFDTLLKQVNSSYAWTLRHTNDGCYTTFDEANDNSKGCTHYLRGDGSWINNAIARAWFVNQYEVDPDGGCFTPTGQFGPDPDPLLIRPVGGGTYAAEWQAPGDCDKLPDGSETFQAEIYRPEQETFGLESCLLDTKDEIVMVTFDITITAQFS